MAKLTKVVIMGLLFIGVSTSLLLSAEETITMTTFYPSPYGSYNELAAVKMKIGSGYSESSVAPIDNGLIVEGNVGIGTEDPQAKLDVDGGIKVGDSAVCNSDTAGVFRYNGGEMQYCDGSNWVLLQTTIEAFSDGMDNLPTVIIPNVRSGRYFATVYGIIGDFGNSDTYEIEVNFRGGGNMKTTILNHPDGTAPFAMSGIARVVNNVMEIDAVNCLISGVAAFRVSD